MVKPWSAHMEGFNMFSDAARNQHWTSRRNGGRQHPFAVAILMSIVLFAITVTAESNLPEQAFLGSWRLETFERKMATGDITYPYGKHPVGQLSYDAQGRMSALIMGPDRTRFKADTPSPGTPEEKAAAFDSFIAYAGTYRVDETSHTIFHKVEIASYPNMEGSEQRRTYSFADGKLTLAFNGSGNASGPRGSISRLVWAHY